MSGHKICFQKNIIFTDSKKHKMRFYKSQNFIEIELETIQELLKIINASHFGIDI